jgi:cell division protein FtsW
VSTGKEAGSLAKKKRQKHFYDYSLLFCIIFLTAFGLVMIYSASSYTAQLKNGSASYFMMKQLKIALVGLVLALIISKIDYHVYARFALFGYVLSYVLMIAVSLVGRRVNGKRRWLGVGSLSFQPTELVKITLIVMLAVVITKMGSEINSWKNMGIIMALALPIAAIVAANNLSSGIIIVGIAFVMLFVACKVKWPFFLCGALGLGTIAVAGPLAMFLEKIHLLKAYQLERIHVWMNPEAYPQDGGFQVLQGLYAIGSGGLVGKGLGESIQKMGFVPEAQNDMIFSIICEELGLFGAVSIILVFLFMIFRFMLIADNAPDLFGSLLVVGVMAHIAIQVILNIAVVTNTIPNTGITLPFISYGGTSILFLMIEMGMVLSVSNQIKLEK